MSAPAAPAGTPLPLQEFFEGVRTGRVTVQRCAGCGEPAVPPKAFCPRCHGGVWERLPLGGEGEVASFTVIRVPPARLLAEAPYAIVIVRFPEGVQLLGRLDGVPIEALRVGLPVRLVPSRDPSANPPVVTFAPRG